MRCEECNKEGVITPVCEGCIAKFIKKGEAIELKRVGEVIDKIKKTYDADFEATDFDTPYRSDMMFEDLLKELGIKQTQEVGKK